MGQTKNCKFTEETAPEINRKVWKICTYLVTHDFAKNKAELLGNDTNYTPLNKALNDLLAANFIIKTKRGWELADNEVTKVIKANQDYFRSHPELLEKIFKNKTFNPQDIKIKDIPPMTKEQRGEVYNQIVPKKITDVVGSRDTTITFGELFIKDIKESSVAAISKNQQSRCKESIKKNIKID